MLLCITTECCLKDGWSVRGDSEVTTGYIGVIKMNNNLIIQSAARMPILHIQRSQVI